MSLSGLSDELSQVRTKEERISESDRAHRAVGRVDRTDPAALLQKESAAISPTI